MALVEIFVIISLIGFLAAGVFAMKSYFITRNATNVWMLFAIGFASLAFSRIYFLPIRPDSSLGFLKELWRALELVGVTIIFSSMAVYYKEKRVCQLHYKKKTDTETMRDIKQFGDGV